jgi:HEAT repeat protein
MQSQAGDYAGAWKQMQDALSSAPDSQEGILEQAQIGMNWLRNIRVIEGEQTFTEIVDQVSPNLYKALSSSNATWSADLHSHIGWGNFLKYREGRSGLEIDRQFKRALELDAENVYAHAMWGFWILWEHGPFTQAIAHFDAALKSGRERQYVRPLMVSALLDHRSEESVRELVRLANEMRKYHEVMEEDQRQRVIAEAYWSRWRETLAMVSSAIPPVLASEHLATLTWLAEGSDKLEGYRGFFTARLTELTGDLKKALLLYRTLKVNQAFGYSQVEDEVEKGIARCNTQSTSDIPSILKSLRSGSADDRLSAIAALADISPAPSELAAALTEALLDTEPCVRVSAARVLGRLNESGNNTNIVALISAFRDENDEVRRASRHAALAIGPAAAPALVSALTNEHEQIRQNASMVLQQLGADAKDSVVPLVNLLRSTDVELCDTVIEVLQEIGPDAKPAVPELKRILSENSARKLKLGAAYALGKIGPGARDAVPELAKALKAKDGSLRCNAAEALGEIGPGAKDAVPALIEALENDDVRSPTCAVRALGKIGADAKSAIPALIEALKKEDTEYKKNQANSLGLIAQSLKEKRDTTAVPLLRAAIKALEEDNLDLKLIRPVRDALESLENR